MTIQLTDHLVPVPSIFFISESGTPLEIIGNPLPPMELVAKIDSILEKAHPQASTSSSTAEVEQKAHSSTNENIIEESNPTENSAYSQEV